jgi:probable F420-dependent oxidoreductase
MRLGLSLPNNQGVAHVSELVKIAQVAEAAGFASVWTSEHLFHTGYVAERLGDKPYHEALTVLTAVAAQTTTVRLGTSVLVLPWHHPVRLAKTLASLDDLSSGRVVLGVGVAIAEDEYANLGADFVRRGAIADEILQAMKELWTADLPSFAGPTISFDGLRFSPKPVQQPHPPILVGGNSPAALRRVVEHGTGWHPLGVSPNDVGAGVERIGPDFPVLPRLQVRFMDAPWDRPIEQRRTLSGTPDEVRAMLTAYAAHGVKEIVLDTNSTDPLDYTRLIERVGQEGLGG